MPRFDVDFTTVDAGFPVHETGRYRIKVTKGTPFINESKPDENGNTKISYGMAYALTLLGLLDDEGELDEALAGKAVSQYKVWCHSEGGWQFAKSFLMATAGFNVRNQENEANADLFQANEWHIDGEIGDPAANIEYGNGFDLMVDRIVDVTLVKKEREWEGEMQDEQEFKGWTPVA